jgi:hypothetical protein
LPLKNARVWLWGCVSAEVYCVLLQPSCKYLYVQNTGPVCRVSEFLFGIAAKITRIIRIVREPRSEEIS